MSHWTQCHTDLRMKTWAIIVCLLVTGGFSQDEFYKKYAFTKVMSECLGGNIYHNYLQQVANARRECEVEGVFTHSRTPIPNIFTRNAFGVPQVVTVIPTTISPFPTTFSPPQSFPTTFSPHRGFSTTFPPQTFPTTFATPRPGILTNSRGSPPFSLFGDSSVPGIGTSSAPIFPTTNDLPFGPRLPALRQKRALVYTSEDIEDAKMRVEAMIGNFTCLLSKLGVVNSNLDINYEGLSQYTFSLPVPNGLKNDLVKSIGYCRDLMSCLPVDQLRSPVPHQLQRLIAFVKCEKEARLTACLKQDLRKNLSRFNLNLLPRFAAGSDDVETLLSLIIGAESAFEMELI